VWKDREITNGGERNKESQYLLVGEVADDVRKEEEGKRKEKKFWVFNLGSGACITCTDYWSAHAIGMYTDRAYYTYKIAFFNLDSMKNVFIFIFDIVLMWGKKTP
jgi:hypothetical protein